MTTDLPPSDTPRTGAMERFEEPLRPGSEQTRRDLLRLRQEVQAAAPVELQLERLRSLVASVEDLSEQEFNTTCIAINQLIMNQGEPAIRPVMREWEQARGIYKELLRGVLASLLNARPAALQAMLADPVQGPGNARTAFAVLSRTVTGISLLQRSLDGLTADTLQAALDMLRSRDARGTPGSEPSHPAALQALIGEMERRLRLQ